MVRKIQNILPPFYLLLFSVLVTVTFRSQMSAECAEIQSEVVRSAAPEQQKHLRGSEIHQ